MASLSPAELAAAQRERMFNAGRKHKANASDPIFAAARGGASLARLGALAFFTLALTLIFWPAALVFLLLVVAAKVL